MSLFKTYGIVLKTTKVKENDFLLDVFCYDYGKLKLKTTKSKTIKTLDIGYILNFEIDVQKQNKIHEIKNIKIKNEFDYLNKNYLIIIKYLELLKIINDKCPLGMPIFEIFNILNEINLTKNITEEKIIFSQLKILNILGVLKQENNNEKIQKVLSFVNKESIKNILKLKGLSEDEKKILEKIIKLS
ncbi:MAG: recombination protein O N-terminal domain-containing protein [Candidatus Gracilibacteria bacterium]|nr:recombination protein O N-terminal domain-containing protein [Candidatus Gracilibacteria bacterium]